MNAPEKPKAKAAFVWDDPLLLNDQLSEDERMVRDAAAAYCQDKLAPRVLEMFRNESSDPSIFREMGELGLLGATIPAEYGGAGREPETLGIGRVDVHRAPVLAADEMGDVVHPGVVRAQVAPADQHEFVAGAIDRCREPLEVGDDRRRAELDLAARGPQHVREPRLQRPEVDSVRMMLELVEG